YLLRPLLLLLFLPQILVQLWRLFGRWCKSFLKKAIPWFGLLICLLTWEGYKLVRTDHLLDAHPIYHEQNQTVFRPTHQALTAVFREFEYHAGQFHTWEARARQGAISSDTLQLYATSKGIDDDLLLETLQRYGSCQQAVQQRMMQQRIISLTKAEHAFIQFAADAQRKIDRKQTLADKLKLRGQVLGELMLKSHLHLDVFRLNNWWTVPIKILVIMLNIITVLVSILGTWKHKALGVIVGGMLVYLIYLTEIQVLVEERYAYPILLLSLGLF
ncbi:unnamed protein product, partial [Chrysoparadoxa australica]